MGFYFRSVLILSSGHCCRYLFRVLFGKRGFPYGSLLFLSFVFVHGASALCPDSLVEGLSSSTRADTRLRLTFAASFLFSSSSAFLFFWFSRSVPQCRLFPDIYAGTRVCLSLLLTFIDVTLLDYNFFELRLLVYIVSCAFCLSVYFTIIYIDSKVAICRKYSLYVHSCSLFRLLLQQANVKRNCSLHVSAISSR